MGFSWSTRQKSNFRMDERWRSGLQGIGDGHIGSSRVLYIAISVGRLHRSRRGWNTAEAAAGYIFEKEIRRNLDVCLRGAILVSRRLLSFQPNRLLQGESQTFIRL